jgi:tRNA (cmo5U34)-methyltransferase
MCAMKDNTTSQSATQYDANVGKTIPYYQVFHHEAIDLIRTVKGKPASWLDTGCGTGTLILLAVQEFGNLKVTAADPSQSMIDIAKSKLSLVSGLDVSYLVAGTESLCCEERFDVVTATLAHHYLDPATRAIATEKCFRMLREDGLYVTFETIRARSEAGTEIGLHRWKNAQLANGKVPASVEDHLRRYGTELLPISIDEHLSLLSKVGFKTAELFWVSGLQAGFYAFK